MTILAVWADLTLILLALIVVAPSVAFIAITLPFWLLANAIGLVAWVAVASFHVLRRA